MKNFKRIISMILMAALVLSVLCACGNTQAEEPAAEEPAGQTETVVQEEPAEEAYHTLAIGTLATADSFDPLSSESDMTCFMVYDTILQRDPETLELSPCVAESWEWVDDTTLRLDIHDDIYFSNGEKLTPEDVLYSLWRTIYVNDSFTSSLSFANIDFDASYIDGNSLYLVYTQVNAVALTHLATRWASVLCKSYVESTGEDAFWDQPVGSGAYTLVENVAGSHASFVRNEDYWDELPEANEVTINYYSEASTMYVDLEIGAIDIALNIATGDAERVMNGESAGITYQLVPTYDLIFIALPEYMEVFDDIRVRQAIAYGMDTAAFTEAIYGDLAEVADSTLIKGVNYYESQGVYEYNPDKARELLAEAGYEEGDISLRLIAPSTPVNQSLSEIFQAYMADIGITINVEIYDFATAIPMLKNKEAEICTGSLNGGVADAADNYKTHGADSTNAANLSEDETLNEYLTAGKTTNDPAVRAEAYANVQQWDHENYRWLPICCPMSCMAYEESIESVPTYIFDAPYVKYITFK